MMEKTQAEEHPSKKPRETMKVKLVVRAAAHPVDPPLVKTVTVAAKTRTTRPRKRKSATRNGQ